MGKKKRRNGTNIQRTVEKFVRLGAFLAPAAYAYQNPHGGNPKYRLIDGVKYYSGFNMETGKFSMEDLKTGYIPWIATSTIQTLAHKLNGIIRSL